MADQARSVRITPRAKIDLLEIGRYTEQRWGKLQRNKYLKELDDCFHLLAKNCRLGKNRPEVQEGYYSFPQGAHIIFYLIYDDRIDIIGIPYRAMDVEHYF